MKSEWALLLFGVIGCPFEAEGKNPYAGDPKAAEAGRGMFRIYCSPCHGIHGKGGRGPDLTIGSYSAGERDDDLYRVISQGSSGTEMPGYSASLGDDNIWRLVTYLRAIAQRDRTPIPGNRARGETLFWGKGACGQCHRVGAKGGRLGPDLTKVGRQRSVAYLREALVRPDAELTPGYATITVVTREGKKIVGVQRGFDNFSAQLMDSGENFHSFLKEEVTSMEREFRSLMPSYEKSMQAAELDDLVAYLRSLRGAEVKQ